MWKITLAITLLAGVAATAGEAPKKSSSVTVKCHGRMRHGVAAVGGETTGTTITFKKQVWELKLPDQTAEDFAEANQKAHVTAVGTLRKIAATETKVRWIVDTTSVAKRDSKEIPEGAQMLIRGKLRSASSESGTEPSYTIEAAGLVWPVDLAGDTRWETAAKTLVDESVVLEGDLNFSEDDAGNNVASILVSKLEAVETSPEDAP